MIFFFKKTLRDSGHFSCVEVHMYSYQVINILIQLWVALYEKEAMGLVHFKYQSGC